MKILNQAILQLAVQGQLTAAWRQQHPNVEPAPELLRRIRTEKAATGKKEKPLPPVTEEEMPFALPEGWVWCRLGEVGLFQRGKSKHRPRNDSRLFENGIYPLVQTGDVSQSKKNNFLIDTYASCYNEFGLAQSQLWKKGTFCITIAANIAEVGFLNFDACVPDSVVTFTPFGGFWVKYFQYYFQTTKDEITHYAPATAQKNINLGIIESLLFPLPPLPEQQAIVARVEALLGRVSALEAESERQRAWAEGLLQAALREAMGA